jgi:hypothetical protein
MDKGAFERYLGMRIDSPEVQQLLDQFGRGLFEREDGDPEAYVSMDDRGIEFLFKDEAYVKGTKRANVGDGPFVLTSVFFYNEDGKHYTGPLPYGLDMSDDQRSARAKLGPPTRTSDSDDEDRWDSPTHRLILNYDAEKHISQASVQLPRRR